MVGGNGGPIPAVGSGSRSARIDAVPVPVQGGVVVGVALRPEEVTEHASEVGDVGLGLELERAAVGEILGKLGGAALAEGGDGNGLLLLHNELVLLGGRLGLEALPREAALEEVDEDVADGLEVVTAGLLDAKMVVDGGVTGGTGQGAALALGDVLQGAGMAVPLGQTKVDAVDEVAGPAASVGDEVGGLDVTVDEVAGVHQLDALQHLVGDHEDRLEGESAAALVELILEGRAEKVHHHEVVRILGAKVVDLGEARGILQLTVHLVLVTELWTASAMLFEFNSNLTLGGEGVEQRSEAHKVRHTMREMRWTDRTRRSENCTRCAKHDSPRNSKRPTPRSK